jgi:membrane protein implicated in regulation of membrane protease activity
MLHTLQTLPGMLSVIVASVVGTIGALAALAIGLPSLGVVLVAAGALVIAMVWLTFWGRRGLRRPDPSLEPRFPSPRA